jgi:hypothetical protein
MSISMQRAMLTTCKIKEAEANMMRMASQMKTTTTSTTRMVERDSTSSRITSIDTTSRVRNFMRTKPRRSLRDGT